MAARVREAALRVRARDGRLSSRKMQGGLAVSRASSLSLVTPSRRSAAPRTDTASDAFPLKTSKAARASVAARW